MAKAYSPLLDTSPPDELAAIAWAKALPIGTRIELSPACDLWMRGARFGEIRGGGRAYAIVKMDKVSGFVKVPYGNIFARVS